MTEAHPPSNPTVDAVRNALRASGADARDVTQCGQCGGEDTHPKVHISGVDEPYHHDCLPFRLRTLTVESSPEAAAVVEACEGGLRGDALLAFINTTREG